jgi:dipeptidyl aminopeptidase/acylaminoacyl peptidase
MRSFIHLIPLVVLAIATPAVAQLTPEHVTSLQNVTSVAISPDARWIAYTISQPRAPEEDTLAGQRAYSELWVIAAAGGEARAVVRRPTTASAPAFTPGGDLSFLSRGQVQLVAAACFTGGSCEPRAVTAAPSAVSAYAWSRDGSMVAYTARVPDDSARIISRRRGNDVIVWSELNAPVRLWVRAASGGDARALTPATHVARDFAWAPTGRGLVVQTAEKSDADTDLMRRRIMWVMADGSAPPRLVTRTEGKLGAMAVSPNGNHLAFLSAVSLNDPLAQTVFVVALTDVASAAVNVTPAYEGSALSVDWADANTVRFIAAEGTKTALNTVALTLTAPLATRPTAGPIRRVLGGGAEVFQTASFARDGITFVAPVNTAMHPGEVFVGSTSTKQLRRLTNHNAFLANVQLGRQETVEYTSRDGWKIQGVLVRPLGVAQGARAPLAVLPHGGPEGISFDGWVTNPLYPAQVLASAGYAVFMPNYRGSGGRGVAFSKGDHRDLGGREFDDVLDGITHLHNTGVADSARVGISGTSYGGYFSAWAGTKHSERFRLAMPFAGISNWMAFTGTTDIPEEMALVHWDLWPYEHPMLMWERSPLAHIGKANTPMVIGQGMVDERVHPEQMMELYQALKLKGVQADMVQYPREPHGLLERQHQLDYMRRILENFNRYVKPGQRPRV